MATSTCRPPRLVRIARRLGTETGTASSAKSSHRCEPSRSEDGPPQEIERPRGERRSRCVAQPGEPAAGPRGRAAGRRAVVRSGEPARGSAAWPWPWRWRSTSCASCVGRKRRGRVADWAPVSPPCRGPRWCGREGSAPRYGLWCSAEAGRCGTEVVECLNRILGHRLRGRFWLGDPALECAVVSDDAKLGR